MLSMPPLLARVNALPRTRLYLIAGPAASGKTTFALALARYLNAVVLSMDHYYVDEEQVAKEYDEKYGLQPQWESPDAYDTHKMREDITSLLTTGYASIPEYSFAQNCRVGYQELRLKQGQPLIIEGLYTIRFADLLTDCSDSFVKLFIHADTEVRRARSRTRDVIARGKPPEAFEKRYHFVALGEQRWVLKQVHDADFMIETTRKMREEFFVPTSI